MRGKLLSVGAVLAIAVVAGCENTPGNTPPVGPGSGAQPAGYRTPRTNVTPPVNNGAPPSYNEAAPQGLGGSTDVYDQPGQLPPNSGGTNAGRVGVKEPGQLENR